MRFEFVDWKSTQSEIRTFHLKTCQHSNILHKNEIYSNDECFWWIEAIFLRTCVHESLCFPLYICVIFTKFLHSARVSFAIFLPTMNVVHKTQSQRVYCIKYEKRHIRYHTVSTTTTTIILTLHLPIHISTNSLKVLFESKARTILLETVYFRVQRIQYSNVSLCCFGLTESVHFNRACMSVVDKVNFLLSLSLLPSIGCSFYFVFFFCLFILSWTHLILSLSSSNMNGISF